LKSAVRGNHKQTRRVTRLRRAQRDPIFRQFEIEEIDAHGE
jgi:hypothetical protein